MKNAYPYLYEVEDNKGEIQLEITFNRSGEIGDIFLYNAQIDDMVKADIDSFENQYPSKYKSFEDKIQQLAADLPVNNGSDDYRD